MCKLKVSVIVPVYNIESYLQKCVDSIRHQTLEEIEIILVDDGSTDSSGKICDAYAGIDDRIKVIHKANSGLSDARNAGLEVAKGEFIGFVDGDDFIRAEMYEILYEACVTNHTWMAGCDCFHQRPGENEISFPGLGDVMTQTKKLTAENFFAEVLRYGSSVGMGVWDKLYKRELFDDVRFPSGKLHEDTDIMYRLVFQTDFVMYIPAPFYGHVNRPGSITSWSYGTRDYDRYEANRGMFVYITEHQVDLIDVAGENRCLSNLSILNNMIVSGIYDKKMYRKIRRDTRELLPIIWEHTVLPKDLKLDLCFSCFGYRTYKIYRKLYRHFKK